MLTTKALSPSTLTTNPTPHIRANPSIASSGRVSVVDDPVSLNGVLKGSMSLTRPSLGACSVWGVVPSLWVPVARSLGFTVKSICFGHSSFATALSTFDNLPSVSFKSRFNQLSLLSMVFCDWDTLPSAALTDLWASCSVPFLISGSDSSWQAPAGWSVKGLQFLHSAVGGATDGVFSVTLLAPSALFVSPGTLPAVEQRPGGTIASSLDCRAPCRTLLPIPPMVNRTSLRSVTQLADGSFGSWGLLPHCNTQTLQCYCSA